jgi:hypothetical protein
VTVFFIFEYLEIVRNSGDLKDLDINTELHPDGHSEDKDKANISSTAAAAAAHYPHSIGMYSRS